jgi:hypothetical protein
VGQTRQFHGGRAYGRYRRLSPFRAARTNYASLRTGRARRDADILRAVVALREQRCRRLLARINKSDALD